MLNDFSIQDIYNNEVYEHVQVNKLYSNLSMFGVKIVKPKWEYEYMDVFKNNEHVEPMNWKQLEYYFNLYIGEGHVKIKVRNGAMEIERIDT